MKLDPYRQTLGGLLFLLFGLRIVLREPTYLFGLSISRLETPWLFWSSAGVSIGAGLYFLVDGVRRLRGRHERTLSGEASQKASAEGRVVPGPTAGVASSEILLDEPLNSDAISAFWRLLRYFGVFIVVLVGAGFLSGEPFFRRWEMVEVLVVLLLWPVPPFVIAFFLTRARKRVEVNRTKGLVIAQVFWGDRLLRDSQLRVSKIDRIELRKFPSWNLGVPAELKRVIVLAHLEDGTIEHLTQVAEMSTAERVAVALQDSPAT